MFPYLILKSRRKSNKKCAIGKLGGQRFCFFCCLPTSLGIRPGHWREGQNIALCTGTLNYDGFNMVPGANHVMTYHERWLINLADPRAIHSSRCLDTGGYVVELSGTAGRGADPRGKGRGPPRCSIKHSIRGRLQGGMPVRRRKGNVW